LDVPLTNLEDAAALAVGADVESRLARGGAQRKLPNLPQRIRRRSPGENLVCLGGRFVGDGGAEVAQAARTLRELPGVGAHVEQQVTGAQQRLLHVGEA
jgi:hypothetical protein